MVLDISNNSIGTSWYLNPAYEADPDEEYKYKNTAGGTQDEEPAGGLGPIGVIAVANAIKDIGAMTKLNVSSNALCAEGGKFLAAALKGNHVMKELDISSNYLAEDANDKPDMSGVIAFANAISDMEALSSLNLASNSIGGFYVGHNFKATPEGIVSYSVCKSSRQLLSSSLFSKHRPSRYC